MICLLTPQDLVSIITYVTYFQPSIVEARRAIAFFHDLGHRLRRMENHFVYISNVDFLLSIREAKFAVMFDFFENTGWWIGVAVGIGWFIIRVFSREKKPLPDWSLLGCCSILFFFFGALLAVRSSGTFPQIIIGYGAEPPNCAGTFDTSRLKTFSEDYEIAAVCGFNTPLRDQLDDDKITVSNLFHITGGVVSIVMPYSEKMEGEFDKMRSQAPAGTKIPIQVWTMPILLPKNINYSQVKKLDDIYELKGKILAPQYFK